MTPSINSRLLVAGTVMLAVFLGVTGLALDQAFRQSTEAAARGHLQGQLYGLLASTHVDTEGNLVVPKALPEVRFSTPGSGLYARIRASDDQEVWRSASLIGRRLPAGKTLAAGVAEFQRIAGGGGGSLYVLRFGVSWEYARDQYRDYTITIAEDTRNYESQVVAFRRTLWLWLGTLALGLLGVQWLVMRWGLSPLRRVVAELTAVEAGDQKELGTDYPRELKGLTGRLNAFIRNERRHLERYRNSLGDLAHSLKTPLAVLRGFFESGKSEPGWRKEGARQVGRMGKIIDYQLQRAAAGGPRVLAAPVPIPPLVEHVANSLRKVYAQRKIEIESEVEANACFLGDEGDLIEILGNLLDNAFKYGARRARITIGQAERRLSLRIEDDGPGIDSSRITELLERGARADERTEGQGIGLAVVREIVLAYGGQLAIERSNLGGTAVNMEFQM